ncbi:helix-turn-helix domain-containing protein [Limibacter armeniacum]|uniref:helix-turn-helix domain-containing protein n=1 Tax=Limibacter armeniacum TaxID=466084 RepID=UPI002FE56904
MPHLTYNQRKIIQQGISQGKSNAAIARELKVHRATVGREIKRNGGSRALYDCHLAQRMATYEQRYASRYLRKAKGKGSVQGSRMVYRLTGNFVGSRYYFYDSRRRLIRKVEDRRIRLGQHWNGPVWRWNKTDDRWARRRKLTWQNYFDSLIALKTYMAEKKLKPVTARNLEPDAQKIQTDRASAGKGSVRLFAATAGYQKFRRASA